MARKIPGLRDLKITAPSGYSVQTDMSKCTAHGACTACPYLAREIVTAPDGGRKLVFHYENCMGCGACVVKCPERAITLVRDPKKGIPLDMEDLIQEVKGPAGAKSARA
jgi:Pyruvate/2-oxoacid:ferredoxin oxidoreductase delta subunit